MLLSATSMGQNPPDPVIKAELDGHVVQDFSEINIFVLNGDEIQPCLKAFANRSSTGESQYCVSRMGIKPLSRGMGRTTREI